MLLDINERTTEEQTEYKEKALTVPQIPLRQYPETITQKSIRACRHYNTPAAPCKERTIMREKIYNEYLEQKGYASEKVIAARNALDEALEEYIEAIQEYEFNSTIDFVQSKAAPKKQRKAVSA